MALIGNSGLYALTEVQTYIGFKGNFNCTLGRNGNLKERGIELVSGSGKDKEEFQIKACL